MKTIALLIITGALTLVSCQAADPKRMGCNTGCEPARKSTVEKCMGEKDKDKEPSTACKLAGDEAFKKCVNECMAK